MRTSFERPTSVILFILLCSSLTFYVSAAPVQDEQESQEVYYINDEAGCYYNFQHYTEGDRIVTNEPCLNCTCHNRMLMCYLRVCPFTKAIGQDCTVEKHPDQCCPVISCPEVPVKLLTSTTEQPTTTSAVGAHDNYGCTIRNSFFADGVQVPSDPRKPCELCYCIRNRTACVMQECTLHVEGCRPVYQPGVCCPVRYECDYEDKESSSILHSSNGTSILTTASTTLDCKYGEDVFADGESIATEKPCEHCYCMRGDIVCAVQDCGEPLRGKDCTPLPVPPGQCCPASYTCANETVSYQDPDQSNDIITQVQGIINSIKDDTRPDMIENTAEIINPEEVMAPGDPSAISEIEQHEINDLTPSHQNNVDVNPGALYDSIESGHVGSPNQNVEQPLKEPEVSKPEPIADANIADNVSSASPTSVPINELDSILNSNGNQNVGPEKDELVVSSTPDGQQNSPPTHFESEVSQDVDHGALIETPQEPKPVEIIAPSIESETPTAQDSQNVEAPGAETYQTTSSPSAEENIADTVSPVQTYVEIDATEPPTKDTQPSAQSQNEPVQILGEAPSIGSSSPNPDIFTPQVQDNTETDSKLPQVTESAGVVETQDSSSAGAVETQDSSSAVAIDNDKVDISSTSEKPVSQDVTPGHAGVNHDEVHQDFPTAHDDESAPDLKPNEVVESDETLPDMGLVDSDGQGIPGEGNCLIDGKTYTNTSIIPTSNPCHIKCECISSIPSCTLVSCAPPPPQHKKCEPVQPGRDTCCPTYVCAEEDKVSLEAHNQVSSEPQSQSDTSLHSESPIVPDLPTQEHIKEQEEADQQPIVPSLDTSSTAPQQDSEIVSEPSEKPDESPTSPADPVLQSVDIAVLPSDPEEASASGVTKTPDHELVTSYETVETTIKPYIHTETSPETLNVVPNAESDVAPEVSSNVAEDGVSGTSGDVPSEASFSKPSEESSPSKQPESEVSADSHNQDAISSVPQTEAPLEQTTVVIEEYVTGAPAPVDDVVQSQKPASQDGIDSQTHQDSPIAGDTNERPEPAVASPDVVHDDHDDSSIQYGVTTLPTGNSEELPKPVKEEVSATPVQDIQSGGEQNTVLTDNESSNSVSPTYSPITDSSEIQESPIKTPTDTAASISNQADVPTESSNKEDIATVQPIVGAADETLNVESVPSSDTVTDQPSAGSNTAYVENIQTEVSVQSNEIATEAPVASVIHTDETGNQQNVEVPPSDSVAVPENTFEVSTESLFETTVANEKPYLPLETVSAQSDGTNEGSSISYTVNPYEGSSPQPIISSEPNTEASPLVEIIHQDGITHAHKPESDSVIFIPSSPPSEESISSVHAVVPQATVETNVESKPTSDTAEVPSGVQPPEAISHEPEVTYDSPPAEVNTLVPESSDSQNKIDQIPKEPVANQDISPVSFETPVQVAADIPHIESSSESNTDHVPDTENPILGSSHSSEQLDINENIEGISGQGVSSEDPLKSSTEVNYVGTNAEAESTDAPLGVPGETAEAETIGPVIPDQSLGHQDGASVTENSSYSAEPEISPTVKPETAAQDSNNELAGVLAYSTEAPVEIPETTIASLSEDKPSETVDQNLETEGSISQGTSAPTAVLVESTIPPVADTPNKIPEGIPAVPEVTAEVVSHETEVSVPQGVSSDNLGTAPLTPDQNIPSEKDGSTNTVDDKIAYSTESVLAVTEIPAVSFEDVQKPGKPDSDSHILITSESPSAEGAAVDISESGPSNVAINQDNLSPSVTQQSIPSVPSESSDLVSDVQSSVSTSSSPDPIASQDVSVPIHEQHIVSDIKDADVPAQILPESLSEVNSSPEPQIETEADQQSLNVVSSQSTSNAQPDVNDVRPVSQVNGPATDSEYSTVVSGAPITSSNAQYSPIPSAEIKPSPEQVPYQETPASSSNTPITPPISSSDFEPHEIISEVTNQDSHPVSPVQTETHSEPGSRPVQEQEPEFTPEEVLKPSNPVITENVEPQKPTVNHSQQPSQNDLLTSIIQGHFSDPNKPYTGLGPDIDSQLSELINKVSVSTSVPATALSSSTSHQEILQSSWTPKPIPSRPDETSHRPGDEESFPSDVEYEDEEEGSFGPGTCKYLGKLYISAQQIPRDDPCDFCFCFRSDIICLQQSCPPPIYGCRQESIQGFCCPRYECPVSKAIAFNVSSSSTTTTTTLPPHFNLKAYKDTVKRLGCALGSRAYKVNETIPEASGPCHQCKCGSDGQMMCDPKTCIPDPFLETLMKQASSQRR